MPRDSSYLIGNQHAKGNQPNATAFQQGQEPWNKNRKGIHLSPQSEFKAGVPSGRAVPIGTIRIRVGKHGGRRQHIKSASGWLEYAKWLWIDAYGFLLPGDVVHHLNGDRMADRLDNLIALPRADHPKIHSKWGLHQLTEEQLTAYRARYVEEGTLP